MMAITQTKDDLNQSRIMPSCCQSCRNILRNETCFPSNIFIRSKGAYGKSGYQFSVIGQLT